MTDQPLSAGPWLRRIHALMAKAESTEYPAEAENLLAKAQELMARHAIDEAMLEAAGGVSRDEIVTEAVAVVTPYAAARAALLCRVAEANGCRAVIADGVSGGRRCVLVGHRSDISKTTTLFAALSMHATRSMLHAVVPPFDTPRRFRHAFLLAFASRIGERLRDAGRAARADATRQTGPPVALVLAHRTADVERHFEAEFPFVRKVRSNASSFAGLTSGRAAADRADVGQGRVAGPKGELRMG
jgi:hypothetical protein